MTHKILHFVAVFFLFFSLEAQKVNRAFAITSDNTSNNPFLWMNISEIDLNTGQMIHPLFERSGTAYDLYDGATKTKLTGALTVNNKMSGTPQYPTATMVAAAAYDGRRNRLFITPMQVPELRWIDLDDNNTTLKVYTATLPVNVADLRNEANQITRMVIAADGYGYALTNDANHLIRFSTGRKIIITDLGALQDAADNGAISVHNKCSSFGGDMISDADGNLYLFSAYHSIFRIDVTSKTAAYIGTIKNLPANYTTNGAAIDDDGKLIVSSANSSEGYFSVDMNTWEAKKITGGNKTLSVSDLASSNFAFQKKHTTISPVVFTKPVTQLNRVTVYPNPVTEAVFHVSFDNRETGRYLVQLMDLNERIAMQQYVNVGYKNQVIEIEIPARFSKGMYLVKVLCANGNNVLASKILIN
jgi:Secretion system C-terminal sorting domain